MQRACPAITLGHVQRGCGCRRSAGSEHTTTEVTGIVRWVIGAVVAVLMVVQLSGADETRDLTPLALRALQEALQSPADVYSDEIMARLAGDSGVAGVKIAAHLRQALDRLDAHRQQNTQTWQDLVAARGPDVPQKKAARLLELLIQGARDLTDGQGRYVVRRRLHWAAKKARVPIRQAEGVVLRSLAWGIGDADASTAGGGAGFVIAGRTGVFEIAMDPLRVFFDGQDEAFIREQVRDVQRFVVPRVVRQLPGFTNVSFAVRKRDETALADPDYRVLITVEAMGFSGTNADLRPCAEGTVELTPGHGTAAPWSEGFDWCTEERGSANEDGLGPFFDEVAQRICQIIEEHLKTEDGTSN